MAAQRRAGRAGYSLGDGGTGMQVVVRVLARPSLRQSLRETVLADLQEGDYHLEIEREKKAGRPNGWAKIKPWP